MNNFLSIFSHAPILQANVFATDGRIVGRHGARGFARSVR
jgi:hypothetical protein